MNDVFIICSYDDFTKEKKNVSVTDDMKNAYYQASTEKSDNPYSTYWIEIWNKTGMIAKIEEKDFMDS